MASETSDMLDDRVEWCAADVPIPQMENLYEKISQLFDLVMKQMPLTSYMPKEKEKAYQKIKTDSARNIWIFQMSHCIHLDMA